MFLSRNVFKAECGLNPLALAELPKQKNAKCYIAIDEMKGMCYCVYLDTTPKKHSLFNLFVVRENLVVREGKLVGFVNLGDRDQVNNALATHVCGELLFVEIAKNSYLRHE